MTGPLTGTLMTSGRYQVVSRSPLTGTICDSSSGGVFGQALKAAGLDGLIIRGRAAKPVYLSVHDGQVEVRDASAHWGLDTQQTQKAIQAELGTKASVACIGPAGENRILFAAIMNDKDRAAGRGGLGAVMGAKNLKAVAASGGQPVAIADPAGYKDLTSRLDRMVDKNPVTGKSLQVLGTAVLVNIINAHGMFPTENFRRGVFNDAEGTSGEKIAESLLVRQSACYKCPIGCGRTTKTRDKSGEGPEYETVWAFGAHLGISDLTAITEANYACNELGLDTITMGSTLGCAMELCETGAWDAGCAGARPASCATGSRTRPTGGESGPSWPWVRSAWRPSTAGPSWPCRSRAWKSRLTTRAAPRAWPCPMPHPTAAAAICGPI